MEVLLNVTEGPGVVAGGVANRRGRRGRGARVAQGGTERGVREEDPAGERDPRRPGGERRGCARAHGGGGVMFRIIPRDQEFFVLFEKASANIIEGAERLKELLEQFDDLRERGRAIEAVEHKGESLTHEIIKKLNTSFITPIDREDILALASSLDA